VDGADVQTWFQLHTDNAWPDTDYELDEPAGRENRPNPVTFGAREILGEK